MAKYIAKMQTYRKVGLTWKNPISGSHDIEFEASDDEVAIQMVEDDCGLHYILDYKQDECLASRDECFPIYLNQAGGKEVWRL
jgi:hypothetical protein